MDQLEDKLSALMRNPHLMQQISAMAQSLQEQPRIDDRAAPQSPAIDPAMLSRLAGLTNQNSISQDQQALLRALQPYLPQDRVQKLEKAMRAEKMARLASGLLGEGGLSLLFGR